MRSGLVLAAAIIAAPLTFASPSGAHAEQYCGFNPQPGAIVECGYTSLQGCENDIGKGAMCFVNPYLVFNIRRVTPVAHQPEATG
jgi:Protein of unknown function (DUF3551)